MLGLLIAVAAAAGTSTFYVGSPGITAEDVAKKLGHGGRVESKLGLLYQVRVPKGTNLTGKFKVVLDHAPEGSIADLNAVTDQLKWLKGEKAVSRVERETDFWEALEHYLRGRTDDNGHFDFEAYARAIEHREQMPLPSTYLGKTRAPVAQFEYLGPHDLPTPYRTYFGIGNLSGRKNGVTVGPDGTIFVASAQGGVWRSIDRASTFQPLSDNWPAMATSCVATHPTNANIVLCGTGDKNRWPMPSLGIMRSVDKGLTWTPVTTGLIGAGETVTKIVYDPIDPQLVLATTVTFDGNGAIYRSSNAGETWELTSAPRRDWQDLDVSGVANGFRTWWAVASSATGPVIYRTYFPAGQSWFATPVPHFNPEMRVDVAASKIYPGTVYLLSSAMDTIYRSTTYGADWVSVKNNFPNGEDNLNWSQDGYDFYINATRNGTQDRLWVGLLTLAVSHNSGAGWQDAGRTLTDSALTHNDQHDLVADPLEQNVFWAVNDGGLYRVTLSGNNVSFDSSPNKTIFDVQAYRMSIHPTNNQYLTIGTQDNASPSVRGNFAAWWNLQGGDGGFSGYHPTINGRHLTSSQGGRFFRYDGFTDNTGDELDQVPNGPFLTPMVYAGNGVPYAGSDMLYRWDGSDWIGVAGGMGPIETIERGKVFGSKLFIGSDNGRVYRTSNLGPNRAQIGVFTGTVADIDESPLFNDRILVAIQRGTQSRLMYTTNAGASTVAWQAIAGSGTTSLPQAALTAACFDPHDPGTFYVGSDVGLFMTTDFGQTWANMNPLGLPNVQVTAIEVDPTRTYLYVATFGRGVWRIPLRPLRLHTVTFSQPQIFGGAGVDCRFDLNYPAPPGGVRLQTTWTANLVPPTAPIQIPAGQSSVTVRIGSRPVLTTWYEGVHATLNGATQTALIALHPLPRLVDYTLTPTQIYGGEGFEGQVALNGVTPLDVWVLVQSDPSLLNHPKHIRVRAGQSTATFFAQTQPVLAQTTTMSHASFGGGTASRELTLNAVPTFTALGINPSRVYGGNSATGILYLGQSAPSGFYFGVTSDSGAVTPPVAGSVAGKATASNPFILNTTRRIADTTATITATFLNRTIAQTMTVMAYPLLTQFTLDKSTLFAQGVTQGRLALNIKVRHPGLDVLVSSDSPFAIVPGKVPVPIGSNVASFDVLAGSPTKTELATLNASLDGKVLTTTLTILP